MSGTEVRGGAGGVYARHDDLLLLADLHDGVGDDLRTASIRLAGLLVGLATDRDAVVAAVLSPGTAAEATASSAEAAGALLPLGLVAHGEAGWLRSAVAAYRRADALLEAAAQELQDSTGRGLGWAAPLLGAGAAAWWLGTQAGARAADAVGWDAGESALDGHRAGALTDAERVLAEHPGVVEHVAGGAAGLRQGLLDWMPPGLRPLLGPQVGYPQTFEEAVGSLALLFRDGDPVLGRGGPRHGDDGRPPTGVADLLHGVDRRQRCGPAAARPGEIGVLRLQAPDGTVRWVVELPGTQAWPLRSGTQAFDTATNLHTMAGGSTVVMRGVEQALRAAGAHRGGDVLLVGHSQGGMTAAALAADERFRSAFHVTHVVAAGSPVARADVPPDVQVLAVENRWDLVPQLDGRDNPDRPHVTTVVLDVQRSDLTANHALPLYADGVAGVDAADPSYAAWLASAAGFLDPGNVVLAHEHERVTISRAPSAGTD